MSRTYPELAGWVFDAEEISANVYRAFGRDHAGRRVEATGTDPDVLIEKCIQDALDLLPTLTTVRSSDEAVALSVPYEKPMSLTTEILANYLGRKSSALLADPPFMNWTFEKSFETDLDKPRIDYVCGEHGMDFVCDEQDKVRTIFLYSDESRCFKEGILDLPFTSSRQEVLSRFGSPSKSGGGICDPVLGEYGAWDRFARPSYVIHVEYRLDADVVKKITLMRDDAVP